jgi:hypothetical protein
MVTYIYPNFLQTDREYALSEEHWVKLWNQVDPRGRALHGWHQPWFQPLPRSLSEGNPIFSAVSPRLRRGVRVIQHAPTEPGLEIQAWLDFFGGGFHDPDSIQELVIACALSDLASQGAFSLLEPWVRGESLSFHFDEGGLLLPTSVARSEQEHRVPFVPAA